MYDTITSEEDQKNPQTVINKLKEKNGAINPSRQMSTERYTELWGVFRAASDYDLVENCSAET